MKTKRALFLAILCIVFFNCCAFSQTIDSGLAKSPLFLFQKEITIESDVSGDLFAINSVIHLENATITGRIIAIGSVIKTNGDPHALNYLYNVSFFVFSMTLFAANIICYFILLSIKKSFIEQTSLLLKYDPKSMIRNGLLAYLFAICLGVLFFISVVGIPFTLLCVFVVFLFSLVGQTSISIALGHFVTEKFTAKKND